MRPILFFLVALSAAAQTFSTQCAANACVITVTSGTVTIAGTPPPPGSPVSDAFNETALDTKLWTFLNPAGGAFSMTGTQLLLNVPGGANHDPAFGGANNSVRVRQAIGPAVDFAVMTRFDSIPSQAYQFEGEIVEQDGQNYLRFQFGSDGSPGTVVVNADAMIAGVESSKISATLQKGSATSLWLAVGRTGSTWQEMYSFDGVTYQNVGSFTQAIATNYIGPFGGNYNSTASNAPAFATLVNDFIVGAMPTPPVAGCTPANTIAPGVNLQNAINSAGANLCFNDGTFPVAAAPLKFKPGVTYAKATGTPVLAGNGGYPVGQLAGNSTTFDGLTFTGGGLELTGSVDKFHFTNSTVRDIHFDGSGAAVSGIYQDPVIGAQISNSTIENSSFLNIYAPGQLACNGQFPPGGGQPCDYAQTGITIYNQSFLTVKNSTFDTISGDAFHAMESISCGETGGPVVPQNGFVLQNNLANNTHRIPWEIQLCSMASPVITGNVATKMYLPAAWNIGLSFASESTGARVTQNYIDGASTQGPGWNINGPILEIGGTGTVADGNQATTARGSAGYVYYRQLGAVMGSGAVFSNNKLCGPFDSTLVSFEPPCDTPGACTPFQQINNTVAPSCSGFPPPPAAGRQ